MIRRDSHQPNLQQDLQQAIAWHQQGQLKRAWQGYQRVLKKQPDQPDALHLSGLIAHRREAAGRGDPGSRKSWIASLCSE